MHENKISLLKFNSLHINYFNLNKLPSKFILNDYYNILTIVNLNNINCNTGKVNKNQLLNTQYVNRFICNIYL